MSGAGRSPRQCVVRQCVVLIGGLGTRLGALTRDCPKPLLPVGGTPFLESLLRYVVRFGVSDIVLLAGYKAEVVAEHFPPDGRLARELGVSLRVVVEPEPLGTGGALLHAKDHLDDHFLMMNGDSFFDVDLCDLVAAADTDTDTAEAGASGEPGACLGWLALRRVPDASRFGVVDLVDGRIRAFAERPPGPGPGLVNGGIYWLDRAILEHIPTPPCSLEADVLAPLARAGRLGGRAYDGFFIDIGVPEDYRRAQEELPAALRR